MRNAARIPLWIFVAVLCAFAVACDDVEDIFDDGPSDEPNFTAEGVGENQVTDLLIEILATREGRNVSGEGTFGHRRRGLRHRGSRRVAADGF